jgi:hypothetical protein
MPSGIPAAIEKVVAVSTSEMVFIVSAHNPTKPMATMVTMTPATSVHLREASHATMAKARMTSSQGAADSTFSKKINARDSG